MRLIKIILTIIIWCGGVMHPHANEVEYILVTNEKSDSVSLIDLTTLELIKEIKVGKRPRGLGLAPDKSEIYVAVSGENKIKVIETDNFQITRTFYSGDDPESFAVHPSGLIFISNEEIAQTSVIDPRSGKIIAKIEVGIEPEGVSISPDGNTVVVTSESSNMAHFISSSNYKITKNVIVGARPRASCFSEDGKFVFVTSEISGEISKIRVSDGSIVSQVALSKDMAKPKDILLGTDGRTLFIAGGRANEIYIVDSISMTVESSIQVGRRVWGLALSSSGRLLFTTDGLDHQISVIDTTKRSVIKTVKVGQFPWGVITYKP